MESDESKLKGLFEQKELPSYLEDKVVYHLRQKGLLANQKPVLKSAWVKIPLICVIAIILYAAGFLTNRYQTEAWSNSSDQRYLLLLYEPDEFYSDPSHVAEYSQWMKTVNGATGNELSNSGWTISRVSNALNIETETVSSKYGVLGGFFMIQSNSREKALEIASTCPHLKYNGVIELRQIITTLN